MVIVAFPPGEKYAVNYTTLDQYDYGQILRIQGLKLPKTVEVHFSTQETGGTSITRVGVTEDGVTDVLIPDSVLENGDTAQNYSIFAFVYITDATSGKTEYRAKLEVKARPKPEVPGGNDNPDVFRDAVLAVRESALKAEEDAKKTTEDRKAVEHAVESVKDITEQVARVEELSRNAQEAATQTQNAAQGIITDREQINANKAGVAQLKEDLSELSEEIADMGGGLTQAQITALDGMFKKCAYTGDVSTEYTAFKQAFGIESGGDEPDIPEEPDTPVDPDIPEVTLTSISATYTGGDVTVGTALTDLTGITVTATYSDGTTANVTGYTLSGTIAEGSNTITVSYGGKTTIFTVTGVAEESYVELFNSADLWELGGVQPQGIANESTTRLRTIATLPDDVKKISVDDGYSYILVVYSEEQTELPTNTNTVLVTGKGYYNPNGISGDVSATNAFLVASGTYFNGELIASEVRANINSMYGNTDGDTAHFRILIKNNNNATLTADDGLHIHLWG